MEERITEEESFFYSKIEDMYQEYLLKFFNDEIHTKEDHYAFLESGIHYNSFIDKLKQRIGDLE